MASLKKSEGVNPLSGAILPSLALVLSVVSASLLSYGRFFPSYSGRIAAVLFLAAGAVILVKSAWYYPVSAAKKILRIIVYAVICAAAFSAVWIRAGNLASENAPDPKDYEFSAHVLSADESRYSRRIVVSCVSIRHPERLPVKAISFVPKKISIAAGESLVLMEKPQPIGSDSFLYSLRREGIHYSLRLTDSNYVRESVSQEPLRDSIRRKIVSRNNRIYGDRCGGVVNALWLGDGYFVDKKTAYDFTRSGLLHILAASGSHVAIVAGVPFFLLSLAGLRKRTILPAVSALLAGYLYVTCAPVSLIRACVMFWLFALMYLLRKERQALNALFLSGALIVMFYPFDVYSLGFQLSFFATAGLILYFRYYESSIPRVPFKISESLSLSFSAQMFVFPVIALTLCQINLTGIISNIILVPGMSLVMIASAAPHVIDIMYPPAGVFSGSIFAYFIDINLSAAAYFASFNGHYVFEKIPSWVLPAYAVFCVPPVLFIRRRMFLMICTALPLVFVLITAVTAEPLTQNKEYPLSVQGHSVQFSGEKALIRGGITREEIETVKSLLNRYGYCIPEIELSDVSDESILGTSQFLKMNYVSRMYLGRNVELNKSLRSLLNAAEIDGISVSFLTK